MLIAQRSASMLLPLKWEFPGGKLNRGEDSSECIVREIREELGIEIEVQQDLPSCICHYDNCSIELIPLLCKRIAGVVELLEHAAALWVKPESLSAFDLAEADRPIAKFYLSLLGKNSAPIMPV